MVLDRADYNNSNQNLQSKCRKYLYHNVTLIMSDGGLLDGIIESVEPDRIIMLVGEDVMDLDDDDDEYTYDEKRQRRRRPQRRFRRFRRKFFPFSNIIAVQLLPFFPPHHFIY